MWSVHVHTLTKKDHVSVPEIVLINSEHDGIVYNTGISVEDFPFDIKDCTVIEKIENGKDFCVIKCGYVEYRTDIPFKI